RFPARRLPARCVFGSIKARLALSERSAIPFNWGLWLIPLRNPAFYKPGGSAIIARGVLQQMSLRSAILPSQLNRKPLTALLFLSFVAFAAYKTANYIIADDLQGLAMVALAFVLCACVVAMLNNWRNGLYFFLTWLLFEDLARKYLGNNMAIY